MGGPDAFDEKQVFAERKGFMDSKKSIHHSKINY